MEKKIRRTIDELVAEVDEDLQLETEFRLNQEQKEILKLAGKVTISYANFKPYVKKAIEYLTMTCSDDRCWSCYQDLSSLDFTIMIIHE